MFTFNCPLLLALKSLSCKRLHLFRVSSHSSSSSLLRVVIGRHLRLRLVGQARLAVVAVVAAAVRGVRVAAGRRHGHAVAVADPARAKEGSSDNLFEVGSRARTMTKELKHVIQIRFPRNVRGKFNSSLRRSNSVNKTLVRP